MQIDWFEHNRPLDSFILFVHILLFIGLFLCFLFLLVFIKHSLNLGVNLSLLFKSLLLGIDCIRVGALVRCAIDGVDERLLGGEHAHGTLLFRVLLLFALTILDYRKKYNNIMPHIW